jgi:hypothetical protein
MVAFIFNKKKEHGLHKNFLGIILLFINLWKKSCGMGRVGVGASSALVSHLMHNTETNK